MRKFTFNDKNTSNLLIKSQQEKCEKQTTTTKSELIYS